MIQVAFALDDGHVAEGRSFEIVRQPVAVAVQPQLHRIARYSPNTVRYQHRVCTHISGAYIDQHEAIPARATDVRAIDYDGAVASPLERRLMCIRDHDRECRDLTRLNDLLDRLAGDLRWGDALDRPSDHVSAGVM